MAYPSQDNFAYRPLYGSSPGMVAPQQNQFMPSFQSSLNLSPQLNWNPQGMPATGYLAQAPVQSVVPTTAPMSVGMNWAPEGVAPGTGPLAQIPATQVAAPVATTPVTGTGASTPPSNVGAYANMALQGVNMAANLGIGIASLVQSQDAFNKQMGMANKNYAAQVKAYNNALEDKIRGRYSAQTYAANKKAIESEIDRKKQKE